MYAIPSAPLERVARQVVGDQLLDSSEPRLDCGPPSMRLLVGRDAHGVLREGLCDEGPVPVSHRRQVRVGGHLDGRPVVACQFAHPPDYRSLVRN